MPRKLGQHFLKSGKKLSRIVEVLDVKKGDNVLEIGPGHGELTGLILDKEANVVAIEKDDRLIEILKDKFSEKIQDGSLKIISGDATKKISDVVKEYFSFSEYKIVGNIPYYITGYLLRIIGELEIKPECSVLLIQKEVGERVCAYKDKMNILSASVKFWAETEIVGNVAKKYFSPPPKVESVIIKLITHNKYKEVDSKEYYKFINIIFSKPRKTLKNNLLAGGYENEKIDKIFEDLNIKNNLRAHQLNFENIMKLYASFI